LEAIGSNEFPDTRIWGAKVDRMNQLEKDYGIDWMRPIDE
jgi:hypothetical protein